MAKHPLRAYGCRMTAVAVLLRPVRAATWRELAYLLLGLVMSVVTFAVLVTLLSVGVSLLITLVGVPILLATAYINRWFADIERRRLSLVFADPVGRSYRDASGVGFWERVKVVASDPQTWKDYGWLLLLTVIGFAFGIVAVTLWSTALALVSLPVWWWIPHEPVLEIGDGEWAVDSWSGALLAGAVGVAGVVVTTWLCAAMAKGQALAARTLLAPGLQERVDQLERTRAGAIDAQADELERIERDLHDGAQARLVALSIDLGLAREKLDSDPLDAARLVEAAHEETKTVLVELRELVRGVHPAILTDRGLDAALSALAARSPVPVVLDIRLDGRLPRPAERAAYFVVAEALTNVAKHSGAHAASVRAEQRDGRLVVEVVDDGDGGARPAGGGGLSGLVRRVEALDGTLAIESPPGGPTRLSMEIPCAS
jgi:signal transduction histidine kinase